jgi:hypothetical protein
MKKPYFLVIGAGRSGTSLLASLLHAHPNLECGMEQDSVHAFSGKLLSWWQRDSAKNRVDSFVNSCILHAKASSVKWGNKITTEQLSFLDSLTQTSPEELLFSQLPGTKMIYVLRDGRSCIPSKMSRMGKSLEAATQSWKRSLHTLEYLQNHESDRFILVRMEDLVLRTEEELQRVCTFLDENYHPDMLAGANSDHLPSIYQNQGGVIAEKAQKPDYEDWHRNIENELKKLGYLL